MSLLDVNLSPLSLPGETGLAAIANLFTELAVGLSPEEKQLLGQRFIELSQPFHIINVAISQNIAAFVGKVLHIDPSKVVFIPPQPLVIEVLLPASTPPVPPAKQ